VQLLFPPQDVLINMNTSEAVARLNQQLPLKKRQSDLPEAYRRLHQSILWQLVREGRALNRDEIADQLGKQELEPFLQRVAGDDLVVLDQAGSEVLGAYPVTTEQTPHAINVMGNSIFAMCALDAVSVAPMFDASVKISSHCHLTQAPVLIQMRGHEIIDVQDSAAVQVGVRWQMPVGDAAHSMCMEMVFLQDESVARQWQGDDQDSMSLFSLPAAVDFGAAFFKPLLD